MKRSISSYACLFLFFSFGILRSETLFAHVKWFSDFDWSTPPKNLESIFSPTFWTFFGMSLGALALLTLSDVWLHRKAYLKSLENWFEERRKYSPLIIRVAAFSVILVAIYNGTLLTPELKMENSLIEKLQFLILFFLLFSKTIGLAGIGLVVLWVVGVFNYSIFHMLDYLNVLGVAYFLIVRSFKNDRLGATALPALYATLGFSLIWLGCEKLVYPDWGLYLLEQKPLLALGLPSDYFLMGAAFIEINLGFLLLICLFSRSLSITITLVFFLTTCVFGKIEIIGHTLVHAALIVFLLEGTGQQFTPPALFHKKIPLRLAFALVNFSILLFAVLFAYQSSALKIATSDKIHNHGQIEVTDLSNPPSLKLKVLPDSKAGYNLSLIVSNFTFTPDLVGQSAVDKEGHAHLYINGNKMARLYSPWYHLGSLPPGEYEIKVTLNANDHRDFVIDGKVVEAKTKIVVN